MVEELHVLRRDRARAHTAGSGSVRSSSMARLRSEPAVASGLRLALVGGGTGGHLVPGLHLLAGLIAQRTAPADLVWFVSGRPIEKRVFSEPWADALLASLDHERVVLGLESRSGGAPRRMELLYRSAPAVLRARRALVSHGSEIVLGLGGYTSLPVVLAARSLSIPVALFEINALPGAATRSLSRFAARVLLSTAAASAGVPADKVRVVGAPLSEAFTTPPTEAERRAARVALGFSVERPLIVVLGGSQGALGLNRFVRENSALLAESGVQVLHQCGPRRRSECSQEVPGLQTVEYLDEIELALRAATLVLTRGGASTLAEITGLSVPSVVVPFPGAADRHQHANSRALGDGALTMDEEELLTPAGCELILHLASHAGAGRRAAMSARLLELSRDGVQRIHEELVSLARSGVPGEGASGAPDDPDSTQLGSRTRILPPRP